MTQNLRDVLEELEARLPSETPASGGASGQGGEVVNVTALDRLEARLNRVASHRAYVERLLSVLGDPREWVFTGEVVDHGKGATELPNPPRCACGHPIRYEFIIEHPTRGLASVGSECIGRIGTMAPELAAELAAAEEALRRRIREAEAQARKAAADARAQQAMREYEAAYALVMKWAEPLLRDRRVPYALWYAMFSRARTVEPPDWCPAYKRAADRARWARQQLERLRSALSACGLLHLIAVAEKIAQEDPEAAQ